MELEEVLADHDSEDEIDNDITDFEDMTVRCDNLFFFSALTWNICRLLHSPAQIVDSCYLNFAE
jgi:hypothetical protein